MHQLIQSYTTVENESKIQIEHLHGLLNTMKGHYRELYDKYKYSIDYIEDKLPGTINPSGSVGSGSDGAGGNGSGSGYGSNVPDNDEINRNNALSYILEEQTLKSMLESLEENDIKLILLIIQLIWIMMRMIRI